MMHAGIDEAGYGPTLGPLVVASAWADADSHATLVEALTASGVKDSKKVHKPGNLAPLESIALGGLQWLSGRSLASAAEVFHVLGETAADRTHPWLQGAAELTLPVAARPQPVWKLSSLSSVGIAGRIIHPQAFNLFLSSGANKAELELAAVGQLLIAPPAVAQRTTIVDRLGGRKFYRDFLVHTYPGSMVLIDQEDAAMSRYHITQNHSTHDVSFVVGGESASPLTALASCIAKYARELHMRLFNHYWCARIPGLKPTAGYPEDAKRWIQELSSEITTPLRDALIRRA